MKNTSLQRLSFGGLIGLILLTTGGAPALAQPHFDPHASHRHSAQEIRRWHRGHWVHAERRGVWGWWWVVGGAYYFYPVPIYPAPDPYRHPKYFSQQAARPLDLPVAELPETPTTPAVLPNNAQPNWYFCEAEKAYYPYVQECPTGWKTVPAVPAK